MDPVYVVISVVLAGLVLLGIRWMSSPKTAVRGNRLSALSMLAAILLVLWKNQILTVPLLWIAMAIGSVIGYVMAVRATMIQMPQMVALLNGLGGGASALVALAEILDSYAGLPVFNKVAGQLGLIVGGLTFSGSLIAAAKLDRRMTQKPIVLKNHNLLLNGSIVLMLVLAGLTIPFESAAVLISVIVLVLSLAYGILFAIRVGGADMPITISLLNSFSGLAGSIVGFTISEPLLVAVGAIVGASGLILTQIMCKAMNRSLSHVLSGAIATPPAEKVPAAAKPDEEIAAEPPEPQVPEKKTPGEILAEAKKVIIVPGYGMALAQAQSHVKQLMDLLEERGTEVKFGIHPVAGRMPGHMNVLLAEVDVPYEKLCEMDDINPEFPETDVAIVVGACDVVNPAANTAEGTPIYGMPILNVDEAKHVIVCNLDTQPGYSGVENPLYEMDHVYMLLGDAKETLDMLIQSLKRAQAGEPWEAEVAGAQDAAAASDAIGKKTPGEILAEAKKVIIVPGYGMALAQAQSHVKQ
ncbi:MAG: NAD(P)(+) transhydrogenase (Re/Si-specific) subunit beta, partial [Bacillota bacterium]